MEKELKIIIPEGYEIDKEKSSFEKIVFKKKESERWRDKERERVEGFYIDEYSDIIEDYTASYNNADYNLFATIKQARSALAMARISQIMKNDERFGGVVTDEEWKDVNISKYCIEKIKTSFRKLEYYSVNCFLAFHTREQRDLFLQENEDLVKDYLMIE